MASASRQSIRAALDVRGRLSRTWAALLLSVRRRDARAVFVGTALAYLVGYLYLVGDLSLRGDGASLAVVSDPLARAFEPGPGAFTYEAIAILDVAGVRYLVSPLNGAIAARLASLVGANLALSYLAVRRPGACGVGAGSGLVAAVPALLSGSACCAPVVLLALGIQAGAFALTFLTWLLPIGVAALAASLLYVGGRIRTVDPE